jgi:hypothetical protein
MVEGETKILMFPYENDYRIEITATDVGVMSYMEYHTDKNGNQLSETSIYNIPLEKGKDFSINPENNSELSDYGRLLSNDEVYSISINVTATNNGIIILENNGYVKGESVTVLAIPDKNYLFEGWYENEVRITGADVTYTFSATVDRTLEARFAPIDSGEPSGPMITTHSLANGTVGSDYDETLFATGDKPIVWSLESGELPAGLTLNAETGEISGIPKIAIVEIFTIKALNNAGATTKTLSINIMQPSKPPLDNSSSGGNSRGGGNSVQVSNDPVPTVDSAPTALAEPEIKSFNDVATDAWYSDAVTYVSDNQLMVGVGSGRFAPDMTINRAMFAQLLYNYAGHPAVSSSNPFTDVSSSAWYFSAVVWASSKGIVSGYGNGQFGPEDAITREQIVVIFNNFAKSQNLDISATTDLAAYTDAANISEWALPAVRWAIAEDILNGRSTTTIVPTGTATRAEAAMLFMHFLEDFLNEADAMSP